MVTSDTGSAPPADRYASLRDGELLEACREGDQQAWRELVERFAALVYSIPARAGLDADACDDVFQSVFAVLVERLDTIEDPQSLAKWLITTARRVSGRQRQRNRPAVATGDAADAGAADASEQTIEWERRRRLNEALRRLGGRCEQLLRALYAGPVPPGYREIARRLDVPVGSIGPTRARCLARLLRILGGTGDESDRE